MNFEHIFDSFFSYKVNFGEIDAESSKTTLVSSTLDQLFTTKRVKREAEAETERIAGFLATKNLSGFAAKFAAEGFTLQTFLEMSESDVADVSEVVGLKGGERMRLKQLIRQNLVKNESSRNENSVKQEAQASDEDNQSKEHESS